MKVVAFGSDHAGVSVKGEIVRFLLEEKWEVMDVGTRDSSPVDYPDIARELASVLLKGRSEKVRRFSDQTHNFIAGNRIEAAEFIFNREARSRRYEA